MSNYGKLVAGVVIVLVLLAGCGKTEPAASATPLPPTLGHAQDDAETPLPPSSTSTPIPPSPTATPAPSTDTPGRNVNDEASAPTLIFYNGRVVTMDGRMYTLEALAILADQIVAVGSDEDILALAAPSTELVDLEGRALLPGFVDAHTHILDTGGELTPAQGQDLALENGITTLGSMYVDERALRELQALDALGNLQVRTSAYLAATDHCGDSLGDWYTAHPPTDEFGEMLRIGGVKIWADGGSCGYGAVSDETHPGAGQGDLFMSAGELEGLVRRVDRAGYQLAIHALGDRAIDQVIHALNAVIETPGNPRRHRVEHSFYMIDGQFGRFSEMGVHPVIFGYWPTCDDTAAERRDNWKTTIRRWRELVDANPNLVIAAKTDWPWLGPPSPLLEIYSLTTLKQVAPDGSICEPAPWLAGRTLTLKEALPMVTLNGAYVLFREDEVGSLEPGKLADLIVLSASPLDVALDDLKELEVWMTMVGGETVFCAQGREQFCP